MRRGLVGVVLICMIVFAGAGSSAMAGPMQTQRSPEQQTLAIPVKVWRDCQRIARCTGCKPVYRCRSCEYQRNCAGGRCGWADICVWGPYIPLAPKGVRIIN